MNKKNKSVWITWHFATRSRNLAKYLDLELFEYFENDSLLKRHLYSSFWTLKVLIRNRPKVVFIQLSFLLLVIIAFYKMLMLGNVQIITDCHTKALRRKTKGKLGVIFWWVKKKTFSLVDLAIISNIGLKEEIEELNNNYIILPDKIPDESIDKRVSNYENKYCVYVSSFAVDEPFEEIFEVAKLLPEDLKLFWTGKKPENLKLPDSIPGNIEFTGYITFEEYFNLIGNASCIIGLTTEEDCLQSGAYEALNVEVPMVLTDSKALRSYFSDSAIYTNHDPKNIAVKILEAIDKSEELKTNILHVKELRNKEFQDKIAEIYNYIS